MKCKLNVAVYQPKTPTSAEVQIRALNGQICKAKHKIDALRARTNYLYLKIRRLKIALEASKLKQTVKDLDSLEDISNMMGKVLTIQNDVASSLATQDIMKLDQMSLNSSETSNHPTSTVYDKGQVVKPVTCPESVRGVSLNLDTLATTTYGIGCCCCGISKMETA